MEDLICRGFVILVMLWVIFEVGSILRLEWQREKKRRP